MNRFLTAVGGRKVVFAFFSFLAVFFSEKFGVSITPEQVDVFTALLLGFFGGNALEHVASSRRKPNA